VLSALLLYPWLCCSCGEPTEPGDGTPPDPAIEGFGTACDCEGAGCESFGVPLPNGEGISGCDAVPDDWTGTERVCLRSFTGGAATDTYFANGYCALMGQSCEGDSVICTSAVFGDYASMTACPAGTVLLNSSQTVDVDLGFLGEYSGEIRSKTCALACVEGDTCRAGEHDPALDESSQYGCLEIDGVRFCYDPRNLPANTTATAF